MRIHPAIVLAATLVLAGGAIVAGCSKSSSPTNPYGGGGGGGGGGGATDTPFDSGSLAAPANFSHTFPTAGTVGYHCSFHAVMQAVVIVDASAASTSASVNVANFAFTPDTVRIKPGGTVSWSVTSGTHTVTSN